MKKIVCVMVGLALSAPAAASDGFRGVDLGSERAVKASVTVLMGLTGMRCPELHYAPETGRKALEFLYPEVDSTSPEFLAEMARSIDPMKTLISIRGRKEHCQDMLMVFGPNSSSGRVVGPTFTPNPESEHE